MNRLQFINYGPLGFCLTSLTSHNKTQKCHSTMSLNTKYSHNTQCHTVTHLMNNHLNNPWLDLNMSTCPWFLDIMVDEVSFVNFVTEPIYQLDLLFVFVRILPKIYLLLLRSLRRHTGTLPKQKSLFYILSLIEKSNYSGRIEKHCGFFFEISAVRESSGLLLWTRKNLII